MATTIDAIPLAEGAAGRLFATGIDAVGPDPAGALDLVGADTLVCLIEDAEIELLYPELGVWMAENSRSVRLPIPDFGVPPEDVMVDFVEGLVGRLHGGEALLVHCRGGIGRTSLVCASILMRLGVDHDRALDHVAAHRIGAGPETPQQKALLRTLADRFDGAAGS